MTEKDELTKIHFEHICDQTNYFNDKMTEAFTFFVQTFSAVVGGSVWLAFQKEANFLPKSSKILLSNSLVLLLTLITTARVIGNLTAWWSARKMEHEMLDAVPLPHPIGSTWLEVALVVAVCVACAIFWIENPFRVLAAN